ncbi:MAG: uroporphyrinogen decarboxylase [Candidatus Brocadiae bacterium]|nr:uroporphyrinogen decarboxylase [Candidatus Brocadiia bacterium]
MTPALRDSRFLRACRGEEVDATPVWLMRQAGRYMKEYRDVRARVAFKDLCKDPALAAEVTDTAARRIGADAAIVFSDILLILEPMGAALEYEGAGGPRIETRVASPEDVGRLRAADPEALSFVYDAVRQSRAALPPDVPLIGFSGAPFTLASYLIEGRSAREAEKTRIFMRTEPAAWNALLGRLVDGLIPYLTRQAAAGAQALQIFDTWVGALGPSDYRASVLPHMQRLVAALPAGVPVIVFGTGTAGILELLKETGAGVVGVDSRIGLGAARARLGATPVQGNLDSTVLFAGREVIRKAAAEVLDATRGRPGHVFNLGHGVLPGTPVDNVIALVDAVHELSSRR